MPALLERCGQPGCDQVQRAPYCDQHRRSRSGTPRSAGYRRRWDRLARAFVRGKMCQDCGRKPATDAHHIDGQGPTGPHGFDPRWLRALCKGCHARRTRQGQ